jgi:hypothetical protein
VFEALVKCPLSGKLSRISDEIADRPPGFSHGSENGLNSGVQCKELSWTAKLSCPEIAPISRKFLSGSQRITLN